MTISLALATYNEEENIKACIESCRGLVDEIVVVEGTSTDKTADTAKSLGAKVIIASNPKMFHINKQKAIDETRGDWVLQLDADERVTPELAKEIEKVITMNNQELEEYQKKLPNRELFMRHQKLVTPDSAGSGVYNAFFIPRLNFFLGKYLRYGGVYPDGVIRLFKRGKAHLPCKDVHEIMEVEGRTGWLQNSLKHIDSPNFKRYLERNSRYVDRLTDELKSQRSNLKSTTQISQLIQFIDWMIIKPVMWFLMTTFRHKGILDGWQGIVFSFFSALRFPRAYICFVTRRF